MKEAIEAVLSGKVLSEVTILPAMNGRVAVIMPVSIKPASRAVNDRRGQDVTYAGQLLENAGWQVAFIQPQIVEVYR